jgi:hypothetical protein
MNAYDELRDVLDSGLRDLAKAEYGMASWDDFIHALDALPDRIRTRIVDDLATAVWEWLEPDGPCE